MDSGELALIQAGDPSRNNHSLQTVQSARGDVMELTPADVLAQIMTIQQIMKVALKEGEHFGTIPGCGDKPALLKAGAEKLSFTFRLCPEFDITQIDFPGNHREIKTKCTLRHIVTGQKFSEGVGSCSTLESKYRFRSGAVKETGRPVPREYWNLRTSDPAKAQESLGGKGFSTKKIDGIWQIVEAGEKAENKNPADEWNTVLKMSKKRAFVDAVITATACGDIFTQDIEEIAENLRAASDIEPDPIPRTPQTAPQAAQAPAQATTQAPQAARPPASSAVNSTPGQAPQAPQAPAQAPRANGTQTEMKLSGKMSGIQSHFIEFCVKNGINFDDLRAHLNDKKSGYRGKYENLDECLEVNKDELEKWISDRGEEIWGGIQGQ